MLAGSALVEFDGGTNQPLTVGPVMVRLAEGARTVWTVTERRYRKVYLT